jgi:hypothetical protein
MTLTPLPPDLDATPMGLVRLSAAARLAGITPELLEVGVADGSVPLEIIQIGKRVKLVRGSELGAWLHGQKTS